jgi:hypothetical protein
VNQIRARARLTVRGRPVHRSGSNARGPWSFYSVPVLDEDYNKVDVTLDEGVDPSIFAEGAIVEAVITASKSGQYFRVAVHEASPAKPAVRPVAAAAS